MSEEKKAKKLTDLMCKWQADWGNARPYLDDRMNYYKQYKMIRDPDSHPYKYNPCSPLVFTITESKKDGYLNAYFENERVTAIRPRERVKKDPAAAGSLVVNDRVIARHLEMVINAIQLHPEMEYEENVHDFLLELALYGNAYSMCIPKFDESGNYVGPMTKHISIFDLVPDRRAYRMSNSEYIWHIERNVTKEELRSRIDEGRTIPNGYLPMKDEDIEKLYGDPSWVDKDYRTELLQALGFQDPTQIGGINEKDGTIVILHYYNTRTGHYCSLGGNRVVVRDTSQPVSLPTDSGSTAKMAIPPYLYNPYDELRLWGFPKEWYAQGVGSVVGGFQDDINLLKSMRLENLELALHKVYLVNEGFNVDVDDLVFRPGAVIPVSDIERAIKVLETGPEITNDAYLEEAEWTKEAQDAASNQDTMRGNATQRREAATTVIALQEGAMKRDTAFLKRFMRWDASQTLKKIIQIRQYMRKEDFERITGEPDAGFYNLQISEITKLFDIIPETISLSISRDGDRQSLVQFGQMFGGLNVMKPNAWAELGMELWFPTKDPRRFVITEEEAEQMQMAQAQQGLPTNAQGDVAPPQGGQTSQPQGQNPADVVQQSSPAGQQGGY